MGAPIRGRLRRALARGALAVAVWPSIAAAQGGAGNTSPVTTGRRGRGPSSTTTAGGRPSPSAATSTPSAATADPNEARAEERFREGSAAFDDGQVDVACAAFADSLHLFPTLGTLLNLALCHEKQGRTATAWREFTGAAAWAADPGQRERREFAHQHASRLERLLARVRIVLAPAGPAAPTPAIAIDGQPVPAGELLLPVFLDPGDHRLVASAPAHASYDTSFVVASGGNPPLSAVVVTVPPLVAAPPPPPPRVVQRPHPARSSARRFVGGLSGGAGVLALGAGVGFGIDAIGKADNLAACKAACDAGPLKRSEGASLAAFGASAVLLAAGAWLLFAPIPGDQAAARAPGPGTAAGARVAIVPLVTVRGGAIGLAGGF